MDLLSLIIKMNKIAGKHGYGRLDMIEDRVVGIKSREVLRVPRQRFSRSSTGTPGPRDACAWTAQTLKQKAKHVIDQQWATTVYRRPVVLAAQPQGAGRVQRGHAAVS
jgi:argininosuccinate synthase